ncbi:hypothetical protein KX816_19545 [Sphingosinicellaceae bacterium]|nr:hypothetical protein KX816_19545 [Sphingosinicellaceae bacterium]
MTWPWSSMPARSNEARALASRMRLWRRLMARSMIVGTSSKGATTAALLNRIRAVDRAKRDNASTVVTANPSTPVAASKTTTILAYRLSGTTLP